MTNLQELGEFALIDRLTSGFSIKQKSTVTGVGDDAAVIDRGDYFEVLTTDLLVEGVHFDMSYTPLKHLGYKSVAVNVSDVCAMNGTPTHITVGLAVSSRFTVEALDELYEGIAAACEHYGIDLVGGDTTTTISGLTIAITAVGRVEKAAITRRSGAKPMDLLCVTGDLGAAYMGLQLLEREKEIWKANPEVQPDLSEHDYLLSRQLKPEARTDVVKALAEKGVVPTAMIDVSDGLSSEVMHLCKASAVGMRLFDDKLPIDHTTATQCNEFNIEPTVCALNGGEDYELLFTIAQKDYDAVKNMADVHVIGHVCDASEGAAIVYGGTTEVPLKAQGWKAI